MKKYTYILSLLLLFSVTLSSCEVIGGIFKAGVWTGIIAVVLIVALIIWLITRMGKK